jgi:DNA topoisomerase-1
VKELRAALKDADELYLATDEDREGEAISWHLLEALKPRVPVKRMVFHEITRSAIDEAVRSPRGIDYGLVDAAETRRILDRLYGYEVSPVLWKKVNAGLSAGRVQSPATRLVVEREWERMRFVPAGYWDIEATFATDPGFAGTLVAYEGMRVATGRDFDENGRTKRDDVRVVDEALARGLASRLDASDFNVRSVDEKPYRSSPKAPFMTSTLQQEGGRKLNMSASQVMRVAQGLYERGYITYMRTDSTMLSEAAVGAARSQVTELFGAQFLAEKPRRWEGKVKNAQEAHEAIRPAGEAFRTPAELSGELSGSDLRLYEMIWMRTLASQMADATGQTVTVRIGATSSTREDAEFSASGTTITFPGYRRAYVEGSADAHRRTACAARGPRTEGAHHDAARALHRGVAREATRGARNRSAVDLRVDHADDPGPRLRVEARRHARADMDGVRGGQLARTPLRDPRRLRVHSSNGRRPRRHRT